MIDITILITLSYLIINITKNKIKCRCMMANKKNQRNHRNNHHRSMQRRWSAAKYREKKVKSEAHLSTENCDKLEGSRIINLDKLQQYVNELTTHAAKCGSQIILSGEQKSGLASIISSHCSKCSFIIPLTTSNKVSGPKGISCWELNLAAVWGQMCTGGGPKLKDNMSILGAPVMSPKNFINTERSIGQWWQISCKLK